MTPSLTRPLCLCWNATFSQRDLPWPYDLRWKTTSTIHVYHVYWSFCVCLPASSLSTLLTYYSFYSEICAKTVPHPRKKKETSAQMSKQGLSWPFLCASPSSPTCLSKLALLSVIVYLVASLGIFLPLRVVSSLWIKQIPDKSSSCYRFFMWNGTRKC